MTTPEPSELDVTRVIGLAAFLRPELVDRVDAPTLRRIARETFADLHRYPIPAAFLNAFAEPQP